jgi:hypothetical protein
MTPIPPNLDGIFDGDFEAESGVRQLPPPANPHGRPSVDSLEIRAIEASYERKFNLGNFSSLQVSVTVWARSRLAAGGELNLHDAKRRLRDMARNNVRAQFLRVKERPEQIFLGLEPPADGRFDPIYIRTVGVNLCHKLNLGNYESVAPSYSDWVDTRALSGNQAALHIAMERLWESLSANIADELNRAQGLRPHADAYFGLPEIPVEDLVAPVLATPPVAAAVPAAAVPAAAAPAAAAPPVYSNGRGGNGHRANGHPA